MRNLKVLGLALTAAFAMFAVTASAASAQTLGKITTSNGGAVTLTGTETGGAGANGLSAFGGFLECPGSTYTVHKWEVTPHEALEHGATTATITPHYKETNAEGKPNCSGSLGVRATIDMNGCDYVIHSGETIGEGDTYGATFDIVCPEGKEITVTLWTNATQHEEDHKLTTEGKPDKTIFCTYHIKPQTGLKGAHLTDTSTGDGHIEINGTVEGIHVVSTEDPEHTGLLCANDTIPNPTFPAGGKFKIDVTVEPKNPLTEPGVSLSH